MMKLQAVRRAKQKSCFFQLKFALFSFFVYTNYQHITSSTVPEGLSISVQSMNIYLADMTYLKKESIDIPH